LKTSSLAFTTATFFAAGVFLVTSAAQTPQIATKSGPQAQPPSSIATPNAQQPSGTPAKRTYPTPTNLKVLPKELTGEQVHEIMEQWESEIGGRCGTCHAADPKNIGPNGRPRLNFVDDNKPEKETARKMYQMTDGINLNYIAKMDSSGAPVTCGTCHRGHLGPEMFAPASGDHDHAAPAQKPADPSAPVKK
jgi:hypothetical protein